MRSVARMLWQGVVQKRKMKRPPTEAALPVLPWAVEPEYPAIFLPYLDIAPFDVLLCGLNRRVIIGALNTDALGDLVIIREDVDSILAHLLAVSPSSSSKSLQMASEWCLAVPSHRPIDQFPRR